MKDSQKTPTEIAHHWRLNALTQIEFNFNGLNSIERDRDVRDLYLKQISYVESISNDFRDDFASLAEDKRLSCLINLDSSNFYSRNDLLPHLLDQGMPIRLLNNVFDLISDEDKEIIINFLSTPELDDKDARLIKCFKGIPPKYRPSISSILENCKSGKGLDLIVNIFDLLSDNDQEFIINQLKDEKLSYKQSTTFLLKQLKFFYDTAEQEGLKTVAQIFHALDEQIQIKCITEISQLNPRTDSNGEQILDIDFFFSQFSPSKKPEVYRLIKDNVENSQWGANLWAYSDGQSQFFSRPSVEAPSSEEELYFGMEMPICTLL